jgi:hypothetical protein
VLQTDRYTQNSRHRISECDRDFATVSNPRSTRGNYLYEEARVADHTAWMGVSLVCVVLVAIPFVPSPELRCQSEAQERQLRDDFEEHTCDEDSSKPAEAGESSSNR